MIIKIISKACYSLKLVIKSKKRLILAILAIGVMFLLGWRLLHSRPASAAWPPALEGLWPGGFNDTAKNVTLILCITFIFYAVLKIIASILAKRTMFKKGFINIIQDKLNQQGLGGPLLSLVLKLLKTGGKLCGQNTKLSIILIKRINLFKNSRRKKLAFQARRPSRPVAFFAVILLLVGIVAFKLLTPHITEASWWNDSWLYRKAIQIANSSGSALTDFQVSFTIDTTDQTKFQSDCDDIRITDINGKLLPYWLEGPCNNASSKVWTKVPSLPTTGQTIYVYYGNPSAVSESSTAETFIREISGVQAAWSMDEASWTNDCNTSTVLDSSGNANHGKSCPAGTGPTGGVTGKFNNGGSFDGSEDYIDVGTVTLADNTPWTVVMWVNLDVLKMYNVFYSKQTTSTTRFFAQSGQTFLYNDANTGVSWSTAPSASTWTQIALVCDGTNTNNINYYLNAAAQGAKTLADSSQTINKLGNYSTFFFDGLMDEVRIYSRALANEEIADIYGGGGNNVGYVTTNYANKELIRKYAATAPTTSAGSEEQGPGPVAYWSFDDGTGTVAQDKTSNRNAGTLTNMSATPATNSGWIQEDACIAGKCLGFDGLNDYVNVANTVSGVKSVSFWVRPTSTTQNLLTLNATTNLTVSSGTITASAGFVSPTIYVNGTPSTTLRANSWQHVAVTTATEITASTFKMGYTSSYLSGFMDEVKVFNYARSAAQIKADYAARGTPKGASAKIGDESAWISNGLVGHWKMDETSSPAVDSSGNANTGTWAGTADDAAGKFGNAINLDGNSDYISAAHSSSLAITEGITCSAWIYSTNASAAQDIIYKAWWRYGFRLTNSVLAVLITTASGGPGGTTGSTILSSNQWYHVAFTYDQKTLRLFVNGRQDGSTTSYTGPLSSSESSLYIGSYQGSSEFFNGKIDEARVYNRALSPKEVRDLYNWAPGPKAYLKLEEGAGTSTNDSSGNSNTGTLNSGALWKTGKVGKGVWLDGTDDTVSINDFSY